MSTGVNLGFSPPPVFVDVDNQAWFAAVLGVPGVPGAIDEAKVAQAREIVLDGVRAATRDLDPATFVVVTPDRSAELVHLRVDAVVGDHATNTAAAASLATACDRAHASEMRFVCVLGLTDATGKPAAPKEVVKAIAGLQVGGVEPDAWILDRVHERAGAPAISAQARGGGRDHVQVALRGLNLVADETYGEALALWVAGSLDVRGAASQIGAALHRSVGALAVG